LLSALLIKRSRDNKTLWRALAQATAGHPANLEVFEPAEVLQATAQHGIAPLLNRRLREDSLHGLDEASRQTLAELARNQAAQDLLINRGTQQLLDLLAKNGLKSLLLKGTPVAHLHYPESYLRTRFDTDLYINDADTWAIAALLAENGYRVTGLNERKYSSKQFGADIAAFQQVHTHFDIHYRLSNRVLFRHTLPYEECEKARQPVPALGTNAWTLGTQDLLLHACIHRIAHGRNTERNRILWLYDIHLLWAAMDSSEQEQLVERALQKKIGTLCAEALQSANEAFSNTGTTHHENTPNKNHQTCRRGVSRDLIKPPHSTKPKDETQAQNTHATLPPHLEQLRQNQKTEPTAKLIHASKPRWALADLLALNGLKPRLAFARELLKL
jgi:hypothetical protein